MFGGWEKIEPNIGGGGQGTVYKARSPRRVAHRKEILKRIQHQLRQASRADDFTRLEELVINLADFGGVDQLQELGALKVFDIPRGEPEESKAVGRLQAEMRALGTLQHPAILRLLQGCHLAEEERFIITEYHPNGTLNEHLAHYKGRVLQSLEAFRPLVDAVAGIHDQGAIHRDIKPENIFVAADRRLVLGDFGIVFFKDGGRVTTTFEQVGTSFWMAPWAYKKGRLAMEDVSPSLDVFPLAKVLWSMISGREGFPYWEIDRDENNLEKLFPGDVLMPRINRLLAKCVVRDESACVLTARDLLNEIDRLIESGRSAGQKPEDGDPWPCRMCGRGHYSETKSVMMAFVGGTSNRVAFRVCACDRCGHAEMFG